MKSLSLILKKNIFSKMAKTTRQQSLVVLAILENIFFSMGLRCFIVYFIITNQLADCIAYWWSLVTKRHKVRFVNRDNSYRFSSSRTYCLLFVSRLRKRLTLQWAFSWYTTRWSRQRSECPSCLLPNLDRYTIHATQINHDTWDTKKKCWRGFEHPQFFCGLLSNILPTHVLKISSKGHPGQLTRQGHIPKYSIHWPLQHALQVVWRHWRS